MRVLVHLQGPGSTPLLLSVGRPAGAEYRARGGPKTQRLQPSPPALLSDSLDWRKRATVVLESWRGSLVLGRSRTPARPIRSRYCHRPPDLSTF